MTDEIKDDATAPKRRGRPPGTKNKPKVETAAADAETTTAKAATAAPKRPRKAGAAKPKPTKAEKVKGQTTDHSPPAVEAMTDEQEQVLFGQHLRAYDEALEKKKAAAAALLNVCKLAKAELGPNVVDQIKLAHSLDTAEGERRLKDRLTWQIKIARWNGMPVGHVDDLFATDRQPIEDRMFDEGKKAGLNGEAPKPPNGTTGALHQRWMEGWHVGQEILLSTGVKQKSEDVPAAAPPAVGAREAGEMARRAGEGCSIPAGLNATDGKAWHLGWREADAAMESGRAAPKPPADLSSVNWREQGSRAQQAGEVNIPPDAVPADQRGMWREGWNEASKVALAQAMERSGARTASAHP